MAKRGRKLQPPPHPKGIRFVTRPPEEIQRALFAELERLRGCYEQGYPEALLHAIDYVLREYGPAWAREAYAERFWAWYYYDVVDLAEAFGVKRSRRKIKEIGRQRRGAWYVISAVVNERRKIPLVNHETAIERVAKRLGMTETAVARILKRHPRTRTIIENLPSLYFVDNKPQPIQHKRRSVDQKRR
jgi:hypothetical protein